MGWPFSPARNTSSRVHNSASLGFWVAVVWDPRRFLPPYAEGFVAELADYTRDHYPGRRFERQAPPMRRPDSPAAALAFPAR